MLGVWEFFWDSTKWGGAPPPPVSAPAVVTPAGAGSGKGEDVAWVVDPALEERAPEAFWEARQQYLERLRDAAERIVSHESISESLVGATENLPAMEAVAEAVAQRERAYRAAETARTARELEAEAAKVMRLTLKIAELKAKHDQDEEDLLLLLMVL